MRKSESCDNATAFAGTWPLVDGDWLEEHLDDSDLRLIDATVQIKMWPTRG